jgi:hypothetical protein
MFRRKFFLIMTAVYMMVFSSYSFADELIFAVDIIRHGDRSPVIAIPKSPVAWAQPLGELSRTGMQQEYSLGKKKHIQYIEKNHLLPEHYVSDTMYVRSTDFNRTLMSAESFLLGLYSSPEMGSTFSLPGNFQPIPVHTVSTSADDLLNPKSKSLTALKAKYIFSQNDWKEKELQSKDKLKKWETITGYPLKNLEDVISLADNLHVRKLQHFAMPDGMTNDMANEIIALGTWAFLRKFQDYPLAAETNAHFLQKISADFTAASLNKTLLKYELFSAHDSTILSALASLHHPQKAPPPYASDLNFLLYKTADQKFYVKITYNDQPVILPGCSEECPLADFKKLIR